MKRQSLYIIALSTLALAGCQKESAFHIEDNRDAVVRIAPSIAKVSDNLTKSAVATEEQEEIALLSDNGGFTLPMTCETSEGIDLGGVSSQTSDGVATKGTLYNETGSPESLGKYVSEFMVAAWNIPSSGDPVKVIPDDSASAFGSDYVSNGYQKVMKRTASDDSEYWMTVQPQTATVEGAPEKADDEYIWKSGESKTFYAYANLPASGATIANIASTGQTLTYTVPETAVDQKDILMGFYKGDGKTDATGSEKMTGTASIKFEHPLTAVWFKYGEIEGDPEIKSISLEGVAASGIVTMDAESTIEWSGVSVYDKTVTLGGTSPLVVDDETKLIGEPFIIIPQNLSEHNVKVSVVFNDDSVLEATISTGEWQAGNTNTYTLGYKTVYPEAVDLGLSVLWATFNVGASAPEEYGDYFAWGATEPWYEPGHAKDPTGYWKPGKDGGYSWKNTPYQTSDATTETDTKWSKYLFGNSSKADPSATEEDIDKSVLDLEDDAANVNWGGTWRMPTETEMKELLNNTKKTTGNYKGTSGYYFTSTITGYTDKSIFIPFAGYYTETNYKRSAVFYWTSSLYSVDKVHYAFKLMGTSSPIMINEYRYVGGSVRPVKPKAPTE